METEDPAYRTKSAYGFAVHYFIYPCSSVCIAGTGQHYDHTSTRELNQLNMGNIEWPHTTTNQNKVETLFKPRMT